ncbi:MAG: GNAT family N-acetyltransferase [Phycisphaerales bacterium]
MAATPPEIIPVTLAELDAHPDEPANDDPHAYRLAGAARDMFRTNPAARPEDTVQLLARVEGTIVGRMNLLPGEALTPDGTARVAWGSGYAVHPDTRGRGVGGALMRAMHGRYPLLGALGASAMSEPIFRKLGWTLARAPRLVFVRRCKPVLRARISNAPIAAAAATFVDAGLRVRHAFTMRRGNAPGDVTIRETTSVPPSHLPTSLRGTLCFPRTTAWLDWMRRVVPQTDRRRWTVYLADRAGEPLGYFIVSDRFHETASRWGYRDLRLATVKDWQAADATPESNRVLAEVAARTAMTHDADAVELCTNDPELAHRLRTLGGFVRGSSPLFLHADDSAIVPALADPASWDFRSADGDYFVF